MEATKITVEATIAAPVESVWEYWTLPEHITNWNFASEEWHTPHAENDVRVGGKFSSRMEARDGSFGFDFGGTYEAVETHKLLSYSLEDGRVVTITFTAEGDETKVSETFDAESENPVELQQQGWQAILNNFKKYAEQQG